MHLDTGKSIKLTSELKQSNSSNKLGRGRLVSLNLQVHYKYGPGVEIHVQSHVHVI